MSSKLTYIDYHMTVLIRTEWFPTSQQFSLDTLKIILNQGLFTASYRSKHCVMIFSHAGQSSGILENQEPECHAEETWVDITWCQVTYILSSLAILSSVFFPTPITLGGRPGFLSSWEVHQNLVNWLDSCEVQSIAAQSIEKKSSN